jgi:subtilase family serine protease
MPSILVADTSVFQGYFVAYQSWETGDAYNGDIFVEKYDRNWNLLKRVQATNLPSYQDSPSIALVFDGYNYYLKLAYVSTETGNYDIFVQAFDLNLNFIAKKQVTTSLYDQDFPSIIFDGSQSIYIAYQSWETGSSYGGDIFVEKFNLNLDSLNKVRITTETSYQDCPSLLYNPETGIIYVAYVSNETGNLDIFMRQYDSNLNYLGRKFQLTTHSTAQFRPSLAPVYASTYPRMRGFQLAYYSWESGTSNNRDIFFEDFDLDCNRLRKTQVTNDQFFSAMPSIAPSLAALGSSWCPGYVAYVSDETGNWDIWLQQLATVANPNLSLFEPQINVLTVTVNGVVSAGASGTTITRLHWNWGDGYEEDHWFPTSHTYANYGDYTITVTAYQSDGLTSTATKQLYQLTITVSPTGAGSTNPSPGKYLCNAGQSVTVSATPNSGYSLDHWELDGSNVGSTASYTVSMNRAHSLTAIFSGKPDLTISDISWTPANPVEGDTVNFTVYIKNQGTASAGAFKVAYYVDGSKLGEWSITSLSSGLTSTQTFTWTATVGSHTVKAFADSSYNIAESDENNNQREETFTVSGKPDLTISDISWTPSSPKEGETVTFTVYIQNQGTADAGSFKVAYYIDGAKLGEWSITSLSTSQTINKTFTWTAAYPSHTVKALADSGYSISEKDENNNQKEKTFSVSGKPDLIISDISWSPPNPVGDDTITFTVTIKNQGNASAGSFKVTYYIDGTSKGEWSIYSLSAGLNTTKTFTWTAVEGIHTVKAFVDSSYSIDEKNEANNELTKSFQVAPKPKPDLIVSDISWTPEKPLEGDIVNFTVTIKNNGTLNAGSFKATYNIDGVKLGEWSITSLSIGQTTIKAFAWTAVKGDHVVEVFADSGSNVDESDENNNRRQVSFSVSGKPDLTISDISWDPPNPKDGETVNFTVYIKNQGTASANSFKVDYYIDGVKLGEWSIASLSDGQNTSRTFAWTAVYGAHTVKAFADSSYNIQEKDENNNQKEKSFSVSGRPDLIIPSISWSSTNPVEGDTLTFTVAIKNDGSLNAASFKVDYYIDGVKLGEWSIYSLSVGQNTTKTFTWAAVQGNHSVKAFADSGYNVDEKVETNNEREAPFKVGPKPKPDLIVSDISWSPISPIEGQMVTFTITIQNNGTVNAGSFKVSYYINGSKLGEWSITSLSAGQNISKTFTWTAVQGDHTIKVFADSSYNVDEKIETNNEREETLIGPKPDLTVSDITWSPTNPVEGETVTFTVVIKNRGNASTGSFTVAYYIDSVKLGEWAVSNLSTGQAINKTFTWTAVEGNHAVMVFADSRYNIERKETFQVMPKPKPDLIVSDISWTPEKPLEGDIVNFTITIKNQGDADAVAFNVTYYLDGVKLGEWVIPGLSAGQETNRTFTWSAVEGSHSVKVFADSNNDVQEKDETNNERQEVIGNQPPMASFRCNNGYGYMNNSVVFIGKSTCFNASESYDSDGNIVAYAWDFGDGNITTVDSPIVHHNYTKPGTYTVTLNVTDNKGSWNIATVNVQVILLGDLNDDGKVNIIDIAIVAKAFGKKHGDPDWNPSADLNNDKVINIVDIAIVAREFGSEIITD